MQLDFLASRGSACNRLAKSGQVVGVEAGVACSEIVDRSGLGREPEFTSEAPVDFYAALGTNQHWPRWSHFEKARHGLGGADHRSGIANSPRGDEGQRYAYRDPKSRHCSQNRRHWISHNGQLPRPMENP